MAARIVETGASTVTVAVRERDWTHLGEEMLLVLPNQEAENLMHALEGWKDER